MLKNLTRYLFYAWLITIMLVALSCNNSKADRSKQSAKSGDNQQQSAELIRNTIQHLEVTQGKLPGEIQLAQPRLVKILYERSGYQPVWHHELNWLSPGDSLFNFIQESRIFGLFPEDYHISNLHDIRAKFIADSLSKGDRLDASLWTRADIILTDAFMQIIHDVKLGRLPQDSLSQRRDSVLVDSFFISQFDALHRSGSLAKLISSLEPNQRGYHLLKQGIRKFLDSSDHRSYTVVPAPGKNVPGFNKALQRRLFEGGFISFDSVAADSSTLAEAVKQFQKQKGITVDGRAGEGTVRLLNVNDRERFIRIAISMDKYKMLPEKMPSKYIWVNASANNLELVEGEQVKLSSRVICGKPRTRTPLLTSLITELITYPQWVPPPSIVSKEILPAVKKNPGYLARKGFSLQDASGNEVDPYTVDWSKYSRGIPYRVVQGSGDANALGIMKFVFSNKYSVYLHDTNQRYLFSNTMRSLSHGCVRVQEWEKLAYYILRNDSLNAGNSGYTKIDSVKTWLKKKQKKSIALRNKIPVYIRYMTCEGNDKGIVFYDDVYGEDKMLREKYFANK